jgi:hypothetical protein
VLGVLYRELASVFPGPSSEAMRRQTGQPCLPAGVERPKKARLDDRCLPCLASHVLQKR